MSRGNEESLTCCDVECAAANSCQIGGCQCERCGRYFCADELDESGLCPDCGGRASDWEEEALYD